MPFLIAIYYQDLANCFIFSKVLIGMVFACSDLLYVVKWKLAQCPKYLQSKDAGDSFNSGKTRGSLRLGNHRLCVLPNHIDHFDSGVL